MHVSDNLTRCCLSIFMPLAFELSVNYEKENSVLTIFFANIGQRTG